MLKIAWSEIYAHPLPENHRFPMEKYNLIPQQLMHEGTVNDDNFFAPAPISENDILTTHDQHYWNKLKNLQLSRSEERKTGFPLSKELVIRETSIINGTLQCADYALQYGVAMNIAGGTHHAFTDRGEGFCLLNDIAIASNYLLDNKNVKQILVVDLDVHQGNGTAEIFNNESRVYTFSMHGAKNYPYRKEISDWDIPLPDGTEDRTYLNLLRKSLDQIIQSIKPDFIFYQSGVDILSTDKLGRLNISLEGCKSRDEIVLSTAKIHGIPLVASMGGGYSEDIRLIVEAHSNTFRLASEIFF